MQPLMIWQVSLRGIHWALAGDSDATLVSQLKLMRQDSNDRLDALKNAQIEALQMLSQMGSKALVEALRDVIKDFNSHINEQFGENFKHLNEGVEKLLVWQEQHRRHVETMAIRLNEVLKIAQVTADTHKQVVDQSLSFADTAAELSALLSALETQKAQINSYAQSLAALLNSAKDAMPQIESRITAIATELAQAASKNQQTMSKAIEESAVFCSNRHRLPLLARAMSRYVPRSALFEHGNRHDRDADYLDLARQAIGSRRRDRTS